MKCPKCQKENEGNFCSACGTRLETASQLNSDFEVGNYGKYERNVLPKAQKPKKKGCLIAFLVAVGIMVLPFVFAVGVGLHKAITMTPEEEAAFTQKMEEKEKQQEAEKEAKRLAKEAEKAQKEQKKQQEKLQKEDKKSKESIGSALDETIQGLAAILETVGIDPKDAEDIKRIDDWVNGPRYSFSTHGTTARVYCNMDGTVNTIKVGNDIDLYKQGYEPWSIENFLVDENTKSNLIICAEEAVTACLNYPSTADFPLLDWSFGREFNRYTVNSYVEAKNAFGVESEIPFTAGFWIENEKIKLVYLMVDGTVLKNESEKFPLPERKETGEGIPSATSQNREIRIIDEQLGEYGKRVKLDGWEYCWYYVPAGKYTVISNVKSCLVYVDKNEITKNSDGYIEMENIVTLEMVYGTNQELTIAEDEHISLTIGADITLIPIK